MKVVTAQQMQTLDRYTIEEIGLPGIVLMENAGRAVAKAMFKHFPDLWHQKVHIICGKGNNGGDGLVVARHLSAAGVLVKIFLLAKQENLAGDAAINLGLVQKLGLSLVEISTAEELAKFQAELTSADILVDAIFGTGFTPPVRGLAAEVIELLNQVKQGKQVNQANQANQVMQVSPSPNPLPSGERVGKRVGERVDERVGEEVGERGTFSSPGSQHKKIKKAIVAVDLPSGLSSDTPQLFSPHLTADLTITFGLPKLSHLLPPACLAVGALKIADIGIPQQAVEQAKIMVEVTEKSYIRQKWPPRSLTSHKGTFGHLFILAGSLGKTGAAYLTSQAGARVGAGLVTLGIPASLNCIMEVKLTEVMTLPLAETEEQTLSLKAKPALAEQFSRMSALAIGPGLSTHPEVRELLAWIIEEANLPLVIDADGINNLAGQTHILQKAKYPPILTPHPKELARLLDLDLHLILEDRLAFVRKASQDFNCYCVLKGYRTLIAEPDGHLTINPTGNSALATGGTGDVLTGLIGGLLAQGFSQAEASRIGVYLHGYAADQIRRQRGESGLLAGDLIKALPMAMEELRCNRSDPSILSHSSEK